MADYSEVIRRLFGSAAQIKGIRAVPGGDINRAFLLTLSDGRRVFVKENAKENADFFLKEKEGLAAIGRTQSIRVPGVLETGLSGEDAYLIMEYLEAAPAKRDYWEAFGAQLAGMHRFDPSEWTPDGRYGFPEDNYIGAGQQANGIRNSWVDFFRQQRLEIQFRRAESFFDASGRRKALRLLDRLDQYLFEPEHPSLLHGDLWGGNYVTGPDGYAWLIDPAVYVGHAEADLAMTELFGGFSPVFYDAYKEENEIPPGYSDRRELYNLYHLLNHLNLFGAGYYGAVMRVVTRFS